MIVGWAVERGPHVDDQPGGGQQLQPCPALQLEGAQNRAILLGSKLFPGQASGGADGARLQQPRRTQEAAHVLGAERP
jgi:hypothetical protein